MGCCPHTWSTPHRGTNVGSSFTSPWSLSSGSWKTPVKVKNQNPAPSLWRWASRIWLLQMVNQLSSRNLWFHALPTRRRARSLQAESGDLMEKTFKMSADRGSAPKRCILSSVSCGGRVCQMIWHRLIGTGQCYLSQKVDKGAPSTKACLRICRWATLQSMSFGTIWSIVWQQGWSEEKGQCPWTLWKEPSILA